MSNEPVGDRSRDVWPPTGLPIRGTNRRLDASIRMRTTVLHGAVDGKTWRWVGARREVARP
jgi:hypothetical protein